jgi:carboxyl-terminal processing protease
MTTGKWYTPSGRSIHRERQLLPDGRFVETHPDSLETDSARKSRPQFRSDDGRTVYGGGGITPDVIVNYDTLSTLEQQFLRLIAPKMQVVNGVLDGYAFELKGTVKRDFVAAPAWTAEVMRRVASRSVTIDPRYESAAGRLLTRELERRVARLAFGDAAAKERDLKTDRQLRTAMDLLEKAATQRELFTVAHANLAVRR